MRSPSLPQTGRYTVRLVTVDELARSQREGLFSLFQGVFDNPSEEIFIRDLEKKDRVILLEDEEKLIGFSTLKVFDHEYDGRTVAIVFSGDTVVARSAWTSTAAPRSWISIAMSLRELVRGWPVYWLLLAGSFRTYRFLPLFFRVFHPKAGAPTPPEIHGLMESVASRLFGNEYLPDSGIVRFEGAPSLRKNLSVTSRGRLKNPHIAFYLQSNPGFERGDELVCLTEISRENLSRAGLRMLR